MDIDSGCRRADYGVPEVTLTNNTRRTPDSPAQAFATEFREIRETSIGRRISLLVLPIILTATVLCIIYPFATLLIAAFSTDGEGVNPLGRVGEIPHLWDALWNTVLLVVCSTGAALVIGTVLAWLNEKTNVRMPGLSSIVPILPLLMPPVAGALGYVFLFSPEAGIANGWLASVPTWLSWAVPAHVDIYTGFGVIYTTAIYTVPAVYVLVAAALRNLDGSQIEASRMCGVGPIRSAFRIDLAALRPTLASSATLALISSVAMFTIPVVIGTRARFPVMSVLIYD
jgi:iron(III) transport system permease protein